MYANDSRPELQASVRLVQVVRAALRAARVDVDELTRRAGIEPSALIDPNGRVARAKLSKLLELGREATHDSLFALHAAEFYEPGANVFDHLGVASSTLGEALSRISRYIALADQALEPRLEARGELAMLVFDWREGAESSADQVDFTMATAVVSAKQWLGSKIYLSARFRHPAPADAAEYLRVFGGPVRFDADVDALAFPRLALDLELRGADPDLAAALDHQAKKLLRPETVSSKLADRVRATLYRLLDGGEDPSAEAVAEKLKMSARTLRRRLAQEGTSYQQELDEVRRATSVRLLAEPSTSIDAVAMALGFSDATSFHRAFKRWTGMTPAEYIRNRPPRPSKGS